MVALMKINVLFQTGEFSIAPGFSSFYNAIHEAILTNGIAILQFLRQLRKNHYLALNILATVCLQY